MKTRKFVQTLNCKCFATIVLLQETDNMACACLKNCQNVLVIFWQTLDVIDVESYSKAIDTLLGDKELSKRYAENAMERVRRLFTIPKMIGEMEKCYEELEG